ncbi:MAG: VanZ family protein [Phycisphaerae bacterium]|nr:VanZ family protein [Phycisphaerae bacterium]
MSPRRSALISRLLAGYWLLIFVLTHTPLAPGTVPTTWLFDKPIHAAMYAGLAFLLVRFLAGTRRGYSVRTYFTCFLIVAVYGVFDEWSQGFVDRTPSVLDWLADLAGAILGLLGARLSSRPSSHEGLKQL